MRPREIRSVSRHGPLAEVDGASKNVRSSLARARHVLRVRACPPHRSFWVIARRRWRRVSRVPCEAPTAAAAERTYHTALFYGAAPIRTTRVATRRVTKRRFVLIIVTTTTVILIVTGDGAIRSVWTFYYVIFCECLLVRITIKGRQQIAVINVKNLASLL